MIRQLWLGCCLIAAGSATSRGQQLTPGLPVLVEIPGTPEEPAEFVRWRAGVTFPGFVDEADYGPVLMQPSASNVGMGWSIRSHSWVLRGTWRADPFSTAAAYGLGQVGTPSTLPPIVLIVQVMNQSRTGPGVARPDVVVTPLGDPLTGACPLGTCALSPYSVDYLGSILDQIDPCDEVADIDELRAALGLDVLHNQGFAGQGMAIGIVDGGIWGALLTKQIAAFDAAAGSPKFDHGGVDRVTKGWPTATFGTYFGGAAQSWFEHGHMTATDALIAAPEAEIYDIRISTTTCQVFCPTGTCGLLSNALAGYDWAIQEHQDTGKPQVLSNSWGIQNAASAPAYATDLTHPFNRKVAEAVDEGIVVVFAGGNSGHQSILPDCTGSTVPADEDILAANGHPAVITVAAVNTANGTHGTQYAGYSSTGPATLQDPEDLVGSTKPDVAAPTHVQGYFGGVQLAANLAPVFHTLECQVGLASFCALPADAGTSSACAFTSGTVALLKQASPGTSPRELRRCLKRTASFMGPVEQTGYPWGDHNQYVGAGVLDPVAALECLLQGCSACVSLCADVDSVSIVGRELQTLSLCPGPEFAGNFYWLYGALGTSPGQSYPLSEHLPLNADAYYAVTDTLPNTMIANSLGVLDAAGRSVASVDVNHAAFSSLLAPNSTLYHAYVVLDSFGNAQYVSEAVSLDVRP